MDTYLIATAVFAWLIVFSRIRDGSINVVGYKQKHVVSRDEMPLPLYRFPSVFG